MPGIARLGDQHRGICNHGARCCPHNVSGEIITGSHDTIVNGLSVARLNDSVSHNCPHCGEGHISSSSVTVFANSRGIARIGDSVTYPGGDGVIISSSGNTFAGG